jgi:hypothetical protein
VEIDGHDRDHGGSGNNRDRDCKTLNPSGLHYAPTDCMGAVWKKTSKFMFLCNSPLIVHLAL